MCNKLFKSVWSSSDYWNSCTTTDISLAVSAMGVKILLKLRKYKIVEERKDHVVIQKI